MYYFLLINIISFLFYGIDKYNSIKGKWRIKENTLISLSFLGGVIGSITGIYLFHHKTKKLKFKILNLISLILWITLYFLIN